MDTNSVYKKAYRVDYGNADYYKKLRLSSLFNYFQDIAGLHAESFGLGVEALHEEHGVTWVLVKIAVQIERFAVLNEDISIETWPLEPKKLEFERDYFVKDADGNTIGKAVSSWVIMDVATREIWRTELFPGRFPPFGASRAIDGRTARLKAGGKLQQVYKKVIGYSDIDINGHLNNSKYIDYIADCFPLEKHRQHQVAAIQVNYMNEALPGDTIVFYKDVSGIEAGTVYVEGQDEYGTKTYFRACITLKQSGQNDA